jgi:hypothetical protein
MQDVRVPVPNPFLTQWLVGREARSMVQEVGEIAQAIYRAIGHKDSGRSAREARVETHIDTVGRSPRWVATLTVDQPTSTKRALDDLNHVLNQLGTL